MIVKYDEYCGHYLLFIAGLNIDVSTKEGQLCSLTKFVNWATHAQPLDTEGATLEQAELVPRLREQPAENPLQTNLGAAIRAMRDEQGVELSL